MVEIVLAILRGIYRWWRYYRKDDYMPRDQWERHPESKKKYGD